MSNTRRKGILGIQPNGRGEQYYHTDIALSPSHSPSYEPGETIKILEVLPGDPDLNQVLRQLKFLKEAFDERNQSQIGICVENLVRLIKEAKQ